MICANRNKLTLDVGDAVTYAADAKDNIVGFHVDGEEARAYPVTNLELMIVDISVRTKLFEPREV